MVYSIFLRPKGTFDIERFRRWLDLRADTLLDPLGSGIYMLCGLPQSVEVLREIRVSKPSQFPSCVLVTLKPEEINVFQEYGDEDPLRSAREFVKTVIDETGCEVEDEYGTSWTERVRREGVNVLYPRRLTR
jgi:hypothetical protein